MAGAIAQGVIGKVTEMIVQQAAQEAELICNFTRDFDWLKKRLRTLSGGLKYVDSLSTQDEDVKEWLQNVRDVAWDAEDIVEECAVRPLYTTCVTQYCVCNPNELLFRYRVAKRIEEVKERINSISKDGEQLKVFRDLVPSHSQQPSRIGAGRAEWKGNSILPIYSHPVAIEPKLQHLISFIDDPTAPVIAVVGMGGSGKTYLLQHVFERIKQRYELSIWLSISQSYSLGKLQAVLASHMGNLKDDVKDLMEERAAEMINERLKGRKSLIVLDDVWRAAREDNIIGKLGLPIGSDSQCKVVVTTRNKDVGQNLKARIYEMELLSKQESWQLFCAYAFPDYDNNLPPYYLEEIALQVEKRCARLPLALKTIGASLSGCTDITKWSSRSHQLKESELHRQKELAYPDYRILEILRLSYDSLPAALKPCFSYLSFFPEDELIDCGYLVNLWIAEGFIPQGKDQWDVGWAYLYQLANLCLLEIRDLKFDIQFKYCQIHDLLLDLAIDVSKENGRIYAVEDVSTSVKGILLAKKGIHDTVIGKSKSFSLGKNKSSYPKSLRTLSLYKNPIQKIEANFSLIRFLRVLDLSQTEISALPHCVGKLKLLKLLNLSRTNIKEVPTCVRSLKSLLLLDLSSCRHLKRLPEWINELKCLQHLNIKDCHYRLRSSMHKGISELSSLRVLRSNELRLSVEEDGLLKLDDVSKLTHLQELSLIIKHQKELKSMEDGVLAQLLNMRHLSIESDFSTQSHLPQNITALQDLQTLNAGNFALPTWVCILRNLIALTLWNSECSSYPALETMPNLVELTLVTNNSCREFPKAFGKSSGFPRLRYLVISDFPLLEEWPDLEDGSMALLEKFYLEWCPKVKKFPEGLERLDMLGKFSYSGSGTNEFRERLREGGEVWDKMKAKNPHMHIIDSLV